MKIEDVNFCMSQVNTAMLAKPGNIGLAQVKYKLTRTLQLLECHSGLRLGLGCSSTP